MSDTDYKRVLSVGSLREINSFRPAFSARAPNSARNSATGRSTSYFLPMSDEDSNSQSVSPKDCDGSCSPPSAMLDNFCEENIQWLTLSTTIPHPGSGPAPLSHSLEKNCSTGGEAQSAPGGSPQRVYKRRSSTMVDIVEVIEVKEEIEAKPKQEPGLPVCASNDLVLDEVSKGRRHLQHSPLPGGKGDSKKKTLTDRSQTDLKNTSSLRGSKQSRKRKKLTGSLTSSPRHSAHTASVDTWTQQDGGDSILKNYFADKGESSRKEIKSDERASSKRSQEIDDDSKLEEVKPSKEVSACKEEGAGRATRSKSHSFSSKAVSFGERVRVKKIPTLSSAFPSAFPSFSTPSYGSSSASSSTRSPTINACSSTSVVDDIQSGLLEGASTFRVLALPITGTRRGENISSSPRTKQTMFSPRSPRELFKRLKSKDKVEASNKPVEDVTDGRYVKQLEIFSHERLPGT